MPIDVLASEAHFVDHLAAVFKALPPEARGAFLTSDEQSTARAKSLGYRTERPNGGRNPVLVASYGDLTRAKAMGRPKIAIMEHGAGQSYGGRGSVQHGSYAGGMNRGAASLFLHPGEHPAERDRKAYPRARVEVVGSPYLDTLPKKKTKGRTIAVTFHFNGPLYPETRNAYAHFFPAIVLLASKYEVLGTGHPRLWNMGRPGHDLASRYKKFGIEPVRDFTEVCKRADLLVFDNTSAGFAFAATGRPVVVLNATHYDRRVNHGLRFWDAANVGINCNEPRLLAACIEEALADPPERRADREAALDLVYAYRKGADKRAADALMDWAS